MVTILRLAEFFGAVYLIGRILLALWRLRSARRFLPVVVLCFAPVVANAAGNEPLCDELGSNCICSEPLDTTTYSNSGTGAAFWWNPGDTTTKQCGLFGSTNGFIEENSFSHSGVSSGEEIDNLPAGHTNTYVLKSGSATMGFIGHYLPSTPTARVAMRGYVYYSTDFDFTNENSCTNSGKTFQLGSPGPIMSHTGTPHLYSWTSGNDWVSDTPGQPFDCCVKGPGHDAGVDGEGFAHFRGKWFRYELIVRNTTTTGQTIIQVYRKNVTDDGPEYKIIDTSIATTQPVGDNWTSTIAASLSPPDQVRDLWFDLFRHGNCSGHNALSHVLVAAWSTDSGQRIGAASAIEGGAPPADNTIVLLFEWAPIATGVLWHFRQAIVSGVLVCWMMGGALFSLTSQKAKQLSYTATLKTVEGFNKVLEKVSH